MLVPAHLYKQQIIEELYKTWHNDKYKYYYDWNCGIPDFPDKPDGTMQFASVDKEGNLLGYISFYINWPLRRGNNFGIISFKNSYTFAKDVEQTIRNCFEKYNLNSIEWFCYTNNPVVKNYIKFINRHGGRLVGMLEQASMTQDGILRDCYIFEITKKRWKP